MVVNEQVVALNTVQCRNRDGGRSESMHVGRMSATRRRPMFEYGLVMVKIGGMHCSTFNVQSLDVARCARDEMMHCMYISIYSNDMIRLKLG